MIYTVKNGKIVKLVDREGHRFKTNDDKRKNTKRNKKFHKNYNFYNSNAWHRKSRAIRRAEPLCRACVKERNKGIRPSYKVHLSESVDHIIPLKDDWKDRLDDRNLQPLCHYHHLLKDEKENRLQSPIE